MLPNIGSITRPSPFLLTGFPGVGFPAFKRYYERAKTSRFPSRRTCALQYLLALHHFVSLLQAHCCNGADAAMPGVRYTGSPLPGPFKKEEPGSPRLPGHPCVHLPCSRTTDGLPRQTISALQCCPRDCYYEGSIDSINFEAQSHGFCTRCLRFVPPLLTTTQDSLPAGGQPLPVGFGPTRCR